MSQPDGVGQIDRDQLGDAAFGHRHAEKAVDTRHCDAVMGDDQEAGSGGVGALAEQGAEPVDIGVVERRVDLVEDADRCGIGEKNREDQRERRQRLLKEKAVDAKADRIERKKVMALAQARRD